jgi:hypothetical protein
MKNRLIFWTVTVLLLMALFWMLGGLKDGRAEGPLQLAGLSNTMKKVVGTTPVTGGGGGGAWTPASEGTLQAWYKADSLVLSDNDPISTWTDSSSSGYNATQTLTARPLYKTNIQNSLPAVLFSAASTQSFVTSIPADTKPFTVAVVVRREDYGPPVAFFGASNTGGMCFRNDTNRYADILSQGTADIGPSTTALTDGSTNIIVVTYSSAGAFAYTLNGASAGTGTNNLTFTGSLTQTIGVGYAGSTEYMDGYIMEIMKFSSVVSAATISTYLNNKWAVY